MRVLSLFFACLALFACEQKPGGTGEPSSSGAAPPGTNPVSNASDTTILIGEVGSLTGAQATFGISTRNGIELAIDELNAKGGINGKKVVVRVYDDQGKPEEAAN